MRIGFVSSLSIASATALALMACGGAARDSSSNANVLDAASSSTAHDASPLDAEPPMLEAGTGALDGAATVDDAASCGPGAVAAIPSPYLLQSASFPSDDKGFAGVLNAFFPATDTYSLFLGDFDLPGGSYRSLLSLSEGDTLGDTVYTDATNVYFFDSGGSAGATLGLYSIARAGGSPAAPIVAIDPNLYQGFELGTSDVWFQLQNVSAGAVSIYSVPKSGGSLGSPAYTTAPGLLVEGVYVEDSTIYWVERSAADTYVNTTMTIYSSPLAATLSPTPLAAFVAEGNVATVVSGSAVYFTLQTAIPHPLPQTIPSDIDAGSGGNDGGSILKPGLYALGSGGAVTLVDANGEGPMFAAKSGLFYVANNNITVFDTSSGATSTYGIDSWYTYSVVDETTVLYATSTGCVYEAVPPPK